ncbi:MAG: alpha/beta fold hydrolase [Mesorhizobium sp.]
MNIIKTHAVPGKPRLSVDAAGAGELVIFLHGIGGNKSNWHDNLPEVSRHFLAAALDIRGYGESDDYEGPLTDQGLIDDIDRVIDFFGTSKAHLIGLSMGSEIAPIYAHARPDRVLSLTLCAAMTGSSAMTDKEKQDFLGSRKLPLLNGKEPKDIAGPVARSLIGKKATTDMLARLVDSMSRLHKQSYIKAIEWDIQVDNRGILPTIGVPTHIVAGSDDLLTPPEMGRQVSALVPGSTFSLVQDAGHLINIEKPREFNELAISLLKRKR